MTKRIFRAISIVALVVFLASLVLIMGVLYGYFTDVQQEQLKIETSLAAQGVILEGADYFDGLDVRGYRITWIDADGNVIHDTKSDPLQMENHLDREEVAEALDTGYGQSARYSTTLMQKSIYSAQRLPDGTVLRVSDEHSSMVKLVFRMIQPILIVVLIALGLALFLASQVSKMVVAPLNNLDLDNPLSNENVDEVAPLLRRINSQQRLLKIQEIELGKKQEEFDAVIKSMNEGLVLINREGRVVSINEAAIRAFDASEFAAGRSIIEVSRNLELQRVVDNTLAGERVTKIIELNSRDFEIDASPISADGEVTGAALLIFDVTEKEETERMRREFTANVSHELKTPLHSISGCAELLHNDMVRPEDTKQFTGQIYTEAQRMMRLVNDIIYLSRLDEGAVDMKRETVDVFKIASEVTASLGQEAKAADVSLSLVCRSGRQELPEGVADGADADTAVTMNGVPQLVSSIIYNLCENAIKYNRAGGSVSVELGKVGRESAESGDAVHSGVVVVRGAETAEEYVVLTVSDTGIGIPHEHIARIFERFYRVDKSHSKEVGGTGLGLSIVKHAARVHNASIEITSVVGGGTTIEVRFPA